MLTTIYISPTPSNTQLPDNSLIIPTKLTEISITAYLHSDFVSAAISSFNTTGIMYATTTDTQNTTDVSANIGDGAIIYYLIAGIAVLFICLLIAARFIKSPASKSKFGRKNSFGTLNTVNTKATAGS